YSYFSQKLPTARQRDRVTSVNNPAALLIKSEFCPDTRRFHIELVLLQGPNALLIWVLCVPRSATWVDGR
mgnify:CR=1